MVYRILKLCGTQILCLQEIQDVWNVFLLSIGECRTSFTIALALRCGLPSNMAYKMLLSTVHDCPDWRFSLMLKSPERKLTNNRWQFRTFTTVLPNMSLNFLTRHRCVSSFQESVRNTEWFKINVTKIKHTSAAVMNLFLKHKYNMKL